MSNIELIFYGTDFTPLVKNSKGDKQYGFYFECNGSRRANSVKKLIECRDEQCRLLKAFLEKAQENIGVLIVDDGISNEEKNLYCYHNQQIYFGGLVGVVSIKNFLFENNSYDVTLQINSRFDCDIYDSDVKNIKGSNPYFLMTLLFNGFIPLSNSKVRKEDDGFTDMLLLSLFKDAYNKAYVKGCFKTYHRSEKNDDKLKGSIDVSRHIRFNAGLNNGKIAYSLKEKSVFNYLNHLVVAAYEQLKVKYREQTNLAFGASMKLKDSLETLKYLCEFPKYSKKTIVTKNTKPLSHPFFVEYEDLRRICLKILREDKVSPFSGKSTERIEGILMYVPQLWEKFIQKSLKRVRFKSQDIIRIMNVNSENDYQQETRPDFVFYNNDRPFMVLDAKFKPGWLEVATTGKIGSLLLPDYDKCIRDMVSIKSHATGVIFPTNKQLIHNPSSFLKDEKEYEYVHTVSKYNHEDKFYTFPIFIPHSENKGINYLKWRIKFLTNCSATFKIIEEAVEKADDLDSSHS